MSSFDEEFVTMIGGLTAFAAALRPCYGWVDAKLMPRAGRPKKASAPSSLGEPIDRLPRPQNWPGLGFGMRAMRNDPATSASSADAGDAVIEQPVILPNGGVFRTAPCVRRRGPRSHRADTV
jgi:hypothetical protein